MTNDHAELLRGDFFYPDCGAAASSPPAPTPSHPLNFIEPLRRLSAESSRKGFEHVRSREVPRIRPRVYAIGRTRS